MTIQTLGAAFSLRKLFDDTVELAAELRSARIDALDVPEDIKSKLRTMVAFDEMASAVAEDGNAKPSTLTVSESLRAKLPAALIAANGIPALLQQCAAAALDRFKDDDDALAQSLIGTRIGSFQLRALIAQGGSSVVFRADRTAGDGTQTVALKLLRTGLYSAEAQRRFRREQAILAQLSHPNIAALIEGGVSSLGIPYIAMELVEGEPITQAADTRSLSLEQRLIWFSRLCRTVEAAHSALIIHRDLKPSNLFVTHQGELKVLDFGIAKLIESEDGTSRTHTQSFALTPEYAAPEQFGSTPLTTAVDVYALGVVLGELLTGERLSGTKRASSSVGAKTSAATLLPRGLHSRDQLMRQLRGDLDEIISTALAEEPRLRYRSASAFADDIERYLSGQPVHAHPPSRLYRAHKFVVRHRAGIMVTSLALCSLLGSLGFALWQGMEARQAARLEHAQAVRANTIRDFLEDMFAPIENGLITDKQPSVSDLLASATDKLGKNATLGDAARIDLQLLFSRLHGEMNASDQEQALADQAANLAVSALAPDDPLRLDAEISRAYVLSGSSNPIAAEPLLSALESRIGDGSAVPRPALVRLYDALAIIADSHRNHNAAAEYERKALAERVAFYGDDSAKAAVGYNNLATSLNFSSGHSAEVIDAYRHAYQIQLAHSGAASNFTAFSRRNLSQAEFLAGKLRAAQADLLAVEPVFQAPPNDQHDANILYWQGRCRLAIEIGADKNVDACDHVLRATQQIVSPDNVPFNASTLQMRAQWDIDHADYDAARRRVQQSSALVAASGNSVWIGSGDYLSALLDLAQGDAANSARHFSDAIRNLSHYYPEHLRLNALALRALVCSQNASLPPTSCPLDADSTARSELNAQALGWHPRLLPAHISLARIDLQGGNTAAAAERLRNAIEHAKDEVNPNQIHIVEAQLWLIAAEGEMGDCVRAKSDATRIRKLLSKNGLDRHPLLDAARALLRHGTPCATLAD